MDDDAQPTKLFVGQIPRDIQEDELKHYFHEFGPISEISIIRDNATMTSKGCAFVTFLYSQSALDAVEAMHDKVTLPNSTNMLQVRLAETQTEKENKLFIGMLPKTVGEAELHSMFHIYGELREVHIIRGPDGSPKGCAFVKYVDKEAAIAAIEDLHDTIPVGATRPLVVKFADTKKQLARIQGHNPQSRGLDVAPQSWSPHPAGAAHEPQPESLNQHAVQYNHNAQQHQQMLLYNQLPHQQLMGMHYLGYSNSPASSPQHSSPMAPPVSLPPSPQQNLHGHSSRLMFVPSPSSYYPSHNQHHQHQHEQQGQGQGRPYGMLPVPISMQLPLPTSFQQHHHHHHNNHLSPNMYQKQFRGGIGGDTAMPGRMGPPAAESTELRYGSAPMGVGGPGSSRGQGTGLMYSASSTPQMRPNDSTLAATGQHRSGGRYKNTGNTDSSSNHSRPPEGPDGANLFIYHLPRDLTDADLATLFAPFGNVISAKVFVDKKTADSKGFGFVSYDTIASADTAISAMNGFPIGSKRLKVQHKRVMSSTGLGQHVARWPQHQHQQQHNLQREQQQLKQVISAAEEEQAPPRPPSPSAPASGHSSSSAVPVAVNSYFASTGESITPCAASRLGSTSADDAHGASANAGSRLNPVGDSASKGFSESSTDIFQPAGASATADSFSQSLDNGQFELSAADGKLASYVETREQRSSEPASSASTRGPGSVPSAAATAAAVSAGEGHTFYEKPLLVPEHAVYDNSKGEGYVKIDVEGDGGPPGVGRMGTNQLELSSTNLG